MRRFGRLAAKELLLLVSQAASAQTGCFFASLASRGRQLIRDASDSKHSETQRRTAEQSNLMAIMHLGKSPAMRGEQPEAAQ